MIKDRGTKKWTSFFMPEQIGMLKQMWKDDYKVRKPILDEYEIEEIENKIHYAMEYNHAIIFEIWCDGLIESIEGNVHHIDPLTKILRIQDANEDNHRIEFNDITKIFVLD